MFEGLKQRLLDRIERDCVKSELTYQPKKGSPETITETVYLKRSKIPLVGDWARIYPPINEDGSWNIKNLLFGGNKNLLKLMVFGVIIAIALIGYAELFHYISILEKNCVPVAGFTLG